MSVIADGRTKSFELGGGLPVADFDARCQATTGPRGLSCGGCERGLPT
jgi:hypothetical protein